jgi:sporulation protein YabP
MPEDKRVTGRQHHVILEGRRTLTITGVTDIDSFDDQMVAVFTDEGELVARGSGLHINKIDVDSGELSLDGEIVSLEYTDNPSPRGSVWSRLFR